jgi:hypothetical protein
MYLLPLAAAVVFALIHLVGERVVFKNSLTHRLFHSIAGGVSVSYVFAHLLPEINTARYALMELNVKRLPSFAATLPYLVILLGLIVFYGLEKWARMSRSRPGSHGEQDVFGAGAFTVHILVKVIFNGFIGYLLHHKTETRPVNLLLFTTAMGLHFFIVDHWMTHNHRHRYHRYGRWLLAGAALAGWGFGLFLTVEEHVISLIFGFLAGAVLMNVLKEELQLEREFNFWPFTLSSVVFATILILVE